MKEWFKKVGEQLSQLWAKVCDAFKTKTWLKWVALGVAGVLVVSIVLIAALAGGNGGNGNSSSGNGGVESSSSAPLDSSESSESTESVEPPEKPEQASNGLEYELSEDESYYIVGGIGTNEDDYVWVPAYHKGKEVKAISYQAFGSAKFRGVYLGTKITEVDDAAFQGCVNLEVIEVAEKNENYKSVDGVLYSKDGKTLIVYPQAKAATEMTVPAEVEEFASSAFSGAAKLEKINVDSKNAKFLSVGGNVYTKDGGKTLVQYAVGNKATSFEIPASVQTIGANAFATAKNLTSVKIPASVKTIEDSAFYDCAKLKNVELSEGLQTIEAFAFYYTAVESISIPASVTKIGAFALLSMETTIGEGNAEMKVWLTEVVFAVTEGWKVSMEITKDVDASLLVDAAQAAKLFTDMTDGYVLYNWQRS